MTCPKLVSYLCGFTFCYYRIAQVLLGLSIYVVIMIIKGFMISWGIGQVKDHLSNAMNGAGSSDLLTNLVNSAINKIY